MKTLRRIQTVCCRCATQRRRRQRIPGDGRRPTASGTRLRDRSSHRGSGRHICPIVARRLILIVTLITWHVSYCGTFLLPYITSYAIIVEITGCWECVIVLRSVEARQRQTTTTLAVDVYNIIIRSITGISHSGGSSSSRIISIYCRIIGISNRVIVVCRILKRPQQVLHRSLYAHKHRNSQRRLRCSTMQDLCYNNNNN